MIAISLLTPAEYSDWDRYVSQHQGRTPYHLSGWKIAVEQAYRHTCCYWLAKDSQGNIVGVLPTTWVRSPISKGSLCALPFCDVGGVLADNTEIENALVAEAVGFIESNNIGVFDHRASELDYVAEAETLAGKKVRMILPFPETSEQLFASFKSKLRSQIRKAEKNGLTADVGNSQQYLDGFYQVISRNMRDLGSPVHSKKWFEQVINAYGENAIVANVYYEQQVIGAGIVLFCNGKACIPWASTNSDFNRLAPNMLLYWTLLKFANDQGVSEFDFGRSTFGEGTFKFKQQWGAQPLALNWVQLAAGNKALTQTAQGSGNLRQKVESIWKKLPVGLTTLVGPQVRKYISL